MEAEPPERTMSNPDANANQEIHWVLRLFFGLLGATAALSGPALRAYTSLAGAPDDASSRGLPLLEIGVFLAGWGAVWLISAIVVAYQKETNVTALAVTALGIPGTFAGISVLVGV